MKRIPILVIAGPTASGKTEAAVRVARAVGGEIVSADSMQIYRGLEVGTAKPSREERAQARFHLVDCVDPARPYSVADYQKDAEAAIREVHGRGCLPILCGGTGLYIRAVTGGLDFPPTDDGERAAVRRRLEEWAEERGREALHARLAEVDPAAAARIPLENVRRVIRALEVFELTGQPMSALQRVDADSAAKYNACYFALSRPREALYAAIDRRVDAMLAAGWVHEVRELLDGGLDPQCQALQAIGYRHLAEWLRETGGTPGGGSSGPETVPTAAVVEGIRRDTRRYAKRQLTWFRREPVTQWLEWSDRGDFGALVGHLCRIAGQLRGAVGFAPHGP